MAGAEDDRLARRLAVMGLMLAVVALLAVAGVHNMRARRAAMQAAQAKVIAVQPAADSGFDTGPVPMKGKPAPQFVLLDVAGKKVSMAELKGHPLVINFWATFCGPCKIEMPWFEEFSATYKDKGLVILGVDQDDDMPKDTVAAAAKKIGVTYPILMPAKSTTKDFQLGDYLPETFYIDRNGTVVEQSVGTPTKDQMEANIRKAIGG